MLVALKEDKEKARIRFDLQLNGENVAAADERQFAVRSPPLRL